MTVLISDINQYSPTIKPMLKNIEVIFQSLHNILVTKKGECSFNLDYGIDFEDSLFELIDEINAVEIFRVVTEEIEIQEPRIEIDASETDIFPDPDNNKYELKLVFRLKGEEEKQLFEGSITK